MKQTKGKWFVTKARYNANISKCTVEVKGKTRDLMIARCGFNEANANLIASAPEMLKMLKKLHESCLNHRGKKRRKLGELIAKSEGGE
tara:strand:+ start:213 stop:476 length:264 start_codon:yes stop_codon:yes gene_type:complete